MSRSPGLRATVLFVLFAAGGCSVDPPSSERLNVLLVSLDTTRADRLGPYGYEGVETPHLDALAAGGVLFEQCAAPAPLTVPSHASLMTGIDPPGHGVRDNGRYTLASDVETLAERLAADGWATAAQVGVFVLNRGTGLEQGFDSYRDTIDAASGHAADSSVPLSRRATNELTADVVADGALDWLRTHAADSAGKPFFLFVHFFDPHAPYDPPEPFRSRHDDPNRDPEVNRYLGEISWTDHQLGRLLDGLRELDLEDETLVVVTADHGEAFGEHGEIGHSYFIYDTTVRVPLLFRLPGRLPAGQRVGAQVRLIDIAPTILDLVGASPLAAASGTTLLPTIDGDAPDLVAYSETLAPELDYGYAPLHAARTARWKYILAPQAELYEIATDPGETRNLVDTHSEQARRMRARLEARLTAAPETASSPAAVAPERAAALRSLGYLGGGEPVAGIAPIGERPDPKDRIAEMTRASTALRAFHDGELERAGRLYQALVDEDPDNLVFRAQLATTRLAENRPEEAARHFDAILRLAPGHVAARRGLAQLALRQGRTEAALEQLQALVASAPDDLRARLDYGNLLVLTGDPAAGYRTFEEIVARDPDHADALILLARLDWLRGRMQRAATALERARTNPEAPAEATLQLGWLRATSPDGSARDGAQALDLARSLPAESVVSRLMLAAALAETGDFESAAAAADAAAALEPRSAQDARWRPRAATLAAMFRQGRPYRSSEPL